jgi:hypothetical protein
MRVISETWQAVGETKAELLLEPIKESQSTLDCFDWDKKGFPYYDRRAKRFLDPLALV